MKAECFYVIKLGNNKYYRRNRESVGGVRPAYSVINADKFARLDKAKEKYNKLKENGVDVQGIARYGLLNGEVLK